MRILFTNDDGIHSEGLHALLAPFRDTHHDLFVVAPDREQSGASAAIGDLLGDIRYDEPEIPALAGVPAVALQGPPALCVWTACLGAFGPEPDLIVSGINAGANCGRAVMFSGTIGAALTGANFGKRGLAVSIMHSRRRAIQWQTAAQLAHPCVDWLQAAPESTVLNLNVPNRPLDELTGVTSAPLSSIGSVHSTLHNKGNGRISLAQQRAEPEPGSDSAAVLAGKATVTLLDQIGGAGAHEVANVLAGRLPNGLP